MSSATSGTSVAEPTGRKARAGTRHGGAAIHTCKSRVCYVQYPHSISNTDWCSHCGQTLYHPRDERPVNSQAQLPHSLPQPLPLPLPKSLPHPPPPPLHLALPPGPGIPRPHPYSQTTPWHDFGMGPTPLFGWASVMPRAHSYGEPKFWRYTKPDYRRYCFSVGKADVPYASLPGGPLEGFPAHMAPQLVGRW